jgi:hypothetical protein
LGNRRTNPIRRACFRTRPRSPRQSQSTEHEPVLAFMLRVLKALIRRERKFTPKTAIGGAS